MWDLLQVPPQPTPLKRPTPKKKGTVTSWVERIEAAIQNSGGQASVEAILYFIESRYPDVAGFNYDWKRTILFTLQGYPAPLPFLSSRGQSHDRACCGAYSGDQFKRVGAECGGVWQLCQVKEEVPPWELNNLQLKRYFFSLFLLRHNPKLFIRPHWYVVTV